MTKKEWNKVEYVIENAWNDFDEDRSAVYFGLLGHYDFAAVEAAIHLLVHRGQKFRPAVAEIVGAIKDSTDSPVPAFAEVFTAMLRSVAFASSRAEYQAGDEAKQKLAVTWLEEHSHPMVARFMEAETYERFAYVEYADSDWGALRKKELEGRWDRFVETAEDRLARGLALESSGQRQMAGPKRLDAVALMEGMRPSTPELEAGDPPSESV